MWCQMSILLKLQQILKSPEPLQRRTKGGWQSVSGLNRALFAQTPLRTEPKNIVWGQNQEKDRIWYPSHYHILSPTPFKSHLPDLEVKAVFARQLDIPELHTYLHRVEWFPRNPIRTFYPLTCASFIFWPCSTSPILKTIVQCVRVHHGLKFGRHQNVDFIRPTLCPTSCLYCFSSF